MLHDTACGADSTLQRTSGPVSGQTWQRLRHVQLRGQSELHDSYDSILALAKSTGAWGLQTSLNMHIAICPIQVPEHSTQPTACQTAHTK
jgi:hypothetical protein